MCVTEQGLAAEVIRANLEYACGPGMATRAQTVRPPFPIR